MMKTKILWIYLVFCCCVVAFPVTKLKADNKYRPERKIMHLTLSQVGSQLDSIKAEENIVSKKCECSTSTEHYLSAIIKMQYGLSADYYKERNFLSKKNDNLFVFLLMAEAIVKSAFQSNLQGQSVVVALPNRGEFPGFPGDLFAGEFSCRGIVPPKLLQILTSCGVFPSRHFVANPIQALRVESGRELTV